MTENQKVLRKAFSDAIKFAKKSLDDFESGKCDYSEVLQAVDDVKFHSEIFDESLKLE